MGSHGWNPSRARGRRRSPAGGSIRGGAAQGSPELTEIGAPGVVSTRVWVRRDQRLMRDPLGRSERVLRARTGLTTARGGSARRRITGVRVLTILGVGRVCKSAEEHAQGTRKRVQGSCGAVRGCSASAMAEQGRAQRRERRREMPGHLGSAMGESNQRKRPRRLGQCSPRLGCEL